MHHCQSYNDKEKKNCIRNCLNITKSFYSEFLTFTLFHHRIFMQTQMATQWYITNLLHQSSGHVSSASDQRVGCISSQWEWNSMAAEVPITLNRTLRFQWHTFVHAYLLSFQKGLFKDNNKAYFKYKGQQITLYTNWKKTVERKIYINK